MEYGRNREINVESGEEMMGGRWVDFAYQNDKLFLREIIIILELDGKEKEVL